MPQGTPGFFVCTLRTLLLLLLEQCQDRFAVLGRIDLRILEENLAVLANDKRPTGRSHATGKLVLLAVGVLEIEDTAWGQRNAELLRHGAFFVGEQGKRQIVDLLEKLVVR